MHSTASSVSRPEVSSPGLPPRLLRTRQSPLADLLLSHPFLLLSARSTGIIRVAIPPRSAPVPGAKQNLLARTPSKGDHGGSDWSGNGHGLILANEMREILAGGSRKEVS